MDHQQPAKANAQAQQDKAIFGGRVLGVIDEKGVFVREDGLGLLKGDPMLTLVLRILAGIPVEAEFGDGETYIQCTAESTRGGAA